MKVAITGHTKGIGQGLYQYFTSQGHDVVGFSRSNGYTLPNSINDVISQSLECDVFINNALPVTAQVDLLKVLWDNWKHFNKTIVVVGSEFINVPLPYHLKQYTEYQQKKRELNDLCNGYNYSGLECRIVSVNPGLVDTELLNELPRYYQSEKEKLLSVDEVVRVIDYVLTSPIRIKNITFSKL